MSIARALTTRRGRHAADSTDGVPHRSKTTRMFGGLSHHASIRDKISAPIALTATTNMLAYTAPDIEQKPMRTASVRAPVTPPANSPSMSGKSDDESDSGCFTSVSTPPTSPDSPYPDDKRAMSPEPNHLSCYFTPPRQYTTSAPTNNSVVASSAAAPSAAYPASDAPVIPQRAPSHTKKSYDGLARHRSVSRMSEQSVRTLSSKASFSFSRSSSSSTNTSVASSATHTSAAAKPTSLRQPPSHAPVALAPALPLSKKEYSESHPFGHELAKVSELVEEFSKDDPEALAAVPPIRIGNNSAAAAQPPAIVDEEERDLLRQGLKKFTAEDYICEIQALMTSFFADAPRPLATVWI